MAVFAVVCEAGSFAGAARILGRSPSVVSTQIRELERNFELRLLHRTTRRLALTQAGERYLPHCQAVLAALRDADQLTERMRTRVEGPLRVSAPSALLDVLVAPMLCVLLEAHPNIEVQLFDSDTREDLESGALDVALRVGRLTELEHRARRLGELRDVRVQREGCPDRAVVLPWQHQDPLAGAGVLRASSVAAARALVHAGVGWAVLPEPAVREALAAGELVCAGRGQAVPVYAVHAFASSPPPQVRALVDASVAAAAHLSA